MGNPVHTASDGDAPRSAGPGRQVLLALLTSALAGCTLLATFDERPRGDAGADPALVGAYALEDCAVANPDPFADPVCDYRAPSCSGFADLPFVYAAKGAPSSIDGPLACDDAGMVAFAWGASPSSRPELRVLARVRDAAGACPGAGGQALALFRLDAEDLSLIERVPIALEGGPKEPSLGRSERRLIVAHAAKDPSDGVTRLFILSAAIDRAPLVDAEVPAVWSLHLAARIKVDAGFVPGRVTAVDDDLAGRFYVAVDSATGHPPVVTLADEASPEALPFAAEIDFKAGTTAIPAREALFARVRTRAAGAGLTAERLAPAARADVQKPQVRVIGEMLTTAGLARLRYLLVPGAGAATGLPDPWYAAAPLVPAHPGPGFGEQPANTRLELFTVLGRSFAQLSSCSDAADQACQLPAAIDGGHGSFDAKPIPSCSAAVPFVGAKKAGPPAPKTPTLYATCKLGDAALGSGVVTWHRTAGGFGAAIAAGGHTLFVVRPGGASLGGAAGAQIVLTASASPPAQLASNGPVSATFVDGLGWVVTAVERDTGRLFAQRFGCP